MKVSSLAPQFVIESPEEKSQAELRRDLKLVQAQPSAEPNPDAKQETRNGLKRLAEFISKQRRAPEHLKPEAPSHELLEKPASTDSYLYTPFIVNWSRRIATNSLARVFALELRRRQALVAYKRMQSIKRKREERALMLVS